MNDTQKYYFNEEEVKDYLLKPYIETLNKVCEYAASEPDITRIAVLGLGDGCIDIAVWLKDITEEKCDKYGSRIFNIDKSCAKFFAAEFYLAGSDSDIGVVVYDREDVLAAEEQAQLDVLEAEGFELVGILDKDSTPEEEEALFNKLVEGME